MNKTELAEAIVDWHVANQRDLPWRNRPAGSRDPYAVWVSEIMSQQTRIETVVEYFNQWMIRFPSIEVLAAADQQEVLKVWEGLGYYSRARNLHKAAGYVVERFNGKIPETRKELLELPGIGEYTVGAILSTAFGQQEPVLDGNVKRVLSRLLDIEDPIHKNPALKILWSTSTELVKAAPDGQAGTFNEGLMELGATVCTPQKPRCLICPIQEHCKAAANGTQHERPVVPPRKEIPHFDVTAGVIWEGDPFVSKLLIAQRPERGMLGGLWEFPGGKLEPQDADLEACLTREIREELNGQIEVGKKITKVKHAYSHFRITLHAFHARYLEGDIKAIGCDDFRWIEFDEVENFPFPVTDQKVITVLRKQKRVNPYFRAQLKLKKKLSRRG